MEKTTYEGSVFLKNLSSRQSNGWMRQWLRHNPWHLGYPLDAIETQRLLLALPTPQQIDDYYDEIVGTTFRRYPWEGPSDTSELHDFWLLLDKDSSWMSTHRSNLRALEKSSDGTLAAVVCDRRCWARSIRRRIYWQPNIMVTSRPKRLVRLLITDSLTLAPNESQVKSLW